MSEYIGIDQERQRLGVVDVPHKRRRTDWTHVLLFLTWTAMVIALWALIILLAMLAFGT